MLTPREAERLIRENIPLLHREDCPLAAAHGRVLRADLRADRDLPPFDRVTMDGYALRAAALGGGTRTFRIEGVQAAGMVPRTLGDAADACVEIMTGAVLPTGADCVVPYEETTRATPGTTMSVHETAAKLSVGNAVHRRGGDHRGRHLDGLGLRAARGGQQPIDGGGLVFGLAAGGDLGGRLFLGLAGRGGGGLRREASGLRGGFCLHGGGVGIAQLLIPVG